MKMGLTVLVAVLAVIPLWAHHDLSVTVEQLSKRLSRTPTADLFFQRGVEYRALRQYPKAAQDFQSALRCNPRHALALQALTEARLAGGGLPEAVTLVDRLLAARGAPHDHFLAARVYQAVGQSELVLRHIVQGPTHDDARWLFQASLVPLPQRVKVLAEGHSFTKSIVLRDARLDAMIAAGLGDQALSTVEEELRNSRFKATWWIRRARICIAAGQDGRADLELALAEIHHRLRPSYPDLTLIRDRGVVLALLGRMAAAREDLNQLQKSILPLSDYRLLANLLED